MPVDQESEKIIVESHVVETNRTHLNEEAQALLKELLKPGAKIEAIIPPDADAKTLFNALETCVRGLKILETRMYRLKPIIGRILLIFENKPSLYKSLGYETYTDFVRKGAYETFGLHPTSAYEGKMAARDWPQLNPDSYAAIGPKKLNVLSKFMKGSNSNAEQWLDTAKSMTVTELKHYVEERGLLAPGEADGATFSITTNRNRLAYFRKFFGDGRIHSVVGKKEADVILEAMIQETFDTWVAVHEDRQRAEREARNQ